MDRNPGSSHFTLAGGPRSCAPFSDCTCHGAEWIPLGCYWWPIEDQMNQMFDVAIQHTQEKHHKPSCTNCNAKRRGFPAGFFSDHCNRFWQVEHAKFNMPREIGFWVQKSWKVMRPRSSQLLTGSQAKSLGVRFAIWRGHDRTFSDSSSSPCDSTCADQDDHLSRDPRDFGMKNSAAFWWATHKGRNYQWIGLRENLQETIDFPIKYGVFL